MLIAVLLSVGLVAWSLVANLVLGDNLYVVRNLALSVGLLVLARRLGFTWRDLGLDPTDLRVGWRVGGLAVVVVVAVVTAGALLADVLPGVGGLLDDQRAAGSGASVAGAALVRIPLGTAVFEEVAFRGLLLAVLLQVAAVPWAVGWSSLVFGLWHIAPTIVTLRINEVAPASAAGLRSVVAAVVVTTVGGALFAWLRLVSGSLLAPVLAHWATNAVGLVAAAVTSSGGAGPGTTTGTSPANGS